MTTETPPNIPAHPIVQPPGAIVINEGATLRDQFAMNIMPTFYLEGAAAAYNADSSVADHCAAVALLSYVMADAMLAARDAAPTEPAPAAPQP